MYIYIYAHKCKYTYMYICTCATYVHMYMLICRYICTKTCVHEYMYIDMYTYLFLYVCMYVCIRNPLLRNDDHTLYDGSRHPIMAAWLVQHRLQVLQHPELGSRRARAQVHLSRGSEWDPL